jgi:hypothetical protein
VAGYLAPNTPSVELIPGEWTWQLQSMSERGQPGSGAVDVVIEIKRAAAAPARGALDLHFHFTGAHGWTAETAPDDADFQAAVERMCEFYGAIGIGLGAFTYNDVDPEFATVDSITGANSELHRIYATSRYDTGVSLFFVERIQGPFAGAAIGGIAGGTPGPTLLPSTVRSGVVVATELDPDPRAIGHIMAHETGHFLGLFHTREITGHTDPIEDTPENAQDNLMYPTVTQGDAHLTEGQGFVLRHSPAVVTTEVAR